MNDLINNSTVENGGGQDKRVLAKKRRRYYLHHKVRKQGYRIKTSDKTIFIPYSQKDNISKQIKALQNEYQYSPQLEIE